MWMSDSPAEYVPFFSPYFDSNYNLAALLITQTGDRDLAHRIMRWVLGSGSRSSILNESRRRKWVRVDEAGATVDEQFGGDPAGRRACLDTASSLTCQPEESFDRWVLAYYVRLVLRESPQTGPFLAQRFGNKTRRKRFQSVNRLSDDQFIRAGVTGFNGIFIHRACK
jgi:hypothetical protein